MGKINYDYDDAKTAHVAGMFATEIANRVYDAFNEGFILGVKHAEKVLGEKKDEQD